MLHHKVAVINESSAVTDEQAMEVVGALAGQVQHDFAPAWGITATVHYVAQGDKPPTDSWWLVLLANSDVADALGYHDLTTQGLPLGKVFVDTDIHAGVQWSVTASHELLEMLADPYINLGVIVQNGASVGVYAYENCDPVEADGTDYEVNGVQVSDFVYPRYFDPTASGGTHRLDQCGHISAPFEILAGGFLSYWTPQSGWQQLYRDKARPGNRPRVGSRRERRRTPRVDWLHSTVR